MVDRNRKELERIYFEGIRPKGLTPAELAQEEAARAEQARKDEELDFKFRLVGAAIVLGLMLCIGWVLTHQDQLVHLSNDPVVQPVAQPSPWKATASIPTTSTCLGTLILHDSGQRPVVSAKVFADVQTRTATETDCSIG